MANDTERALRAASVARKPYADKIMALETELRQTRMLLGGTQGDLMVRETEIREARAECGRLLDLTIAQRNEIAELHDMLTEQENVIRALSPRAEQVADAMLAREASL